MQLKGWKKVQDAYYSTYSDSPLGSITPANPVGFASYIFGLGSDHAEDQKKLARLIEGWKKICTMQIHGERLLQTTSTIEVLPILVVEKEHSIQRAGGLHAWEALPDDEKDRLDRETYERVCQRFGEKAWESLPAKERREAQLFIWAGCCMHKEMNSVKGGAQAMEDGWCHRTSQADESR
jgi:hypothetical protein